MGGVNNAGFRVLTDVFCLTVGALRKAGCGSMVLTDSAVGVRDIKSTFHWKELKGFRREGLADGRGA